MQLNTTFAYNVNPEQITTSKQTTGKASTSTLVHMKGTRVQQSQHTGKYQVCKVSTSRTVCVAHLKEALENRLAFERQSNLVSFPSPCSRVHHFQYWRGGRGWYIIAPEYDTINKNSEPKQWNLPLGHSGCKTHTVMLWGSHLPRTIQHLVP